MASWPRACRSLRCIAPHHQRPFCYMGFMGCFSGLIRTLRSTTITAFLTCGLMGCGNAPVGATNQQAPNAKQDWEVEPKFWAPRAILIPRITPPVGVVDSAVDSSKADTSAKPVTPVKKNPFPLSQRDSARWPVPGPPPLPGAILPEHRIVAYYGNPLSRRMGILGELDPDEMLPRLEEVATQWAAADSGQKVLPALHLIATVAQGYPGPGRKHRLQMPDSVIEKVANWAEERGWLLFLDIQTGLSTVDKELPALVPYLKRPYVHLALDPEFAMKDGKKPGIHMGTMDAVEVNHAIDVLSKIVEQHQLPPKVLVVHRWTYKMLTNSSRIRLDPRVQVVIDMDGYGAPANKKGAYRWFVVRHPVQYAGFKLFYKNDKPMMTPEEVLEMYPKPHYIQYQ